MPASDGIRTAAMLRGVGHGRGFGTAVRGAHRRDSWRYRVAEDDQSVYHIIRALGSFADVADNPWLSDSLGRPDLPNEVAEYWQNRQPQIAQAMFGQTEHLEVALSLPA